MNKIITFDRIIYTKIEKKKDQPELDDSMVGSEIFMHAYTKKHKQN